MLSTECMCLNSSSPGQHVQLLTCSRFLLAKIFLDSFVDKITIADVKEAITQLPTHMAGAREDQRLTILNQAYDSAWARINEQKEGFRNIATRVLAWIACAKRPLSTKELQHALAVKVGMDELDEDAIPQIDDMVSFCAGLVTIDEESNVIRLVHYTTQEYFERKKNDWFPHAEAMIAETCISYLSFKTFGEYHLNDASHKALCSHAFYEYASQYWGDHARITGRKLDKTMLEFLMSGAKASNAFYVALRRFHVGFGGHYLNEKHAPYDFTPMSGMHLAVLFALDEAINLLLKDGCPINQNERVFVTPLLLAIDQGHLHIAHMLLDNGDYINLKMADHRPYSDAAMRPKNYNRIFVEKLIATEVAFGEDISWFLEPAIRYGHDAIVELLLRLGANIDFCPVYGNSFSPLHNAVLCKNEALVKSLLDKGANIEEGSNSSGNKPLHVAARLTNLAIIDLLLEKGANIEASNNDGDKPLHQAAQNENVAIIDLFLRKGANIEVSTHLGEKPLHRAAQNRNVAIIDLLLRKGANIEASTHNGETSLHWAAESGNVATTKFLLNKSANIEALDNKGQTPLFFAVLCNMCHGGCDHEAASTVLLEQGANIEALDRKGYTPLLLAAKAGEKVVLDVLLKMGANVNAVTYDGKTPLHLGARNFLETFIIDTLLEKIVDIDAVDSKGRTPLLYALQKYIQEKSEWGVTVGGRDGIQLLLEKGANINAVDNEGRAPLSYELIKQWEKSKGIFDPVSYLPDSEIDEDI